MIVEDCGSLLDFGDSWSEQSSQGAGCRLKAAFLLKAMHCRIGRGGDLTGARHSG